VELARVGHQHGCAEAGEVTADPRAMSARCQRDRGAGKIHEQLGKCGAGVG